MPDGSEALLRAAGGVAVGRLAGFDGAGTPLVAVAADGRPVPARSLVPLGPGDAGAEVAVGWLDGEPERPLVLGRLQPSAAEQAAAAPALVAQADGERVVIEAEREVVLRCGGASITLRRDGSVAIRGRQILSRADGVNCVRGASVQLN